MKKQITILAGLATLLTGCFPVTPLKPGAATIKVTPAPVPASCRYVNPVIANDINGKTQMYSSLHRLQRNEVNILKNQALKLGANVVQITSHQTTYVTNNNGSRVDTHRLVGKAYICSPQVANNLPAGILPESDVEVTK